MSEFSRGEVVFVAFLCGVAGALGFGLTLWGLYWMVLHA